MRTVTLVIPDSEGEKVERLLRFLQKGPARASIYLELIRLDYYDGCHIGFEIDGDHSDGKFSISIDGVRP